MKRPARRLPLLRRPRPAARPETAALEQSCPLCRAPLTGSPLYQRHRVCDACGHHERRGARASILALLDADSFHEIDALLGSADP
ncbi:MAG TPA: hypothetical protein VFQ80_05995, partial [Thermomicrobiales bacterium]|nr:hypothetical protein [Thermomicrobiales bacterium]